MPTDVGKVKPKIGYGTEAMIRIREIADLELRRRIVAALAERRGMSPAAIPEWFELDDADYVDLLNDLKEQDSPQPEDDPRM
jgi:hypothetical protein